MVAFFNSAISGWSSRSAYRTAGGGRMESSGWWSKEIEPRKLEDMTLMSAIQAMFTNTTTFTMALNIFVGVAAAVIAVTSFALLIPLDSIPAVTGVSIILAVAYAIAVLAWVTVLYLYAADERNLIWLNTHLMFLVVLPATVGATAMNVVAVQNTRNLVSGKVA